MTTVVSSNFNNINLAISAYADAARADNALILSSGIVTSDARVTDAGEAYSGTVRWLNYTDPATQNKPVETGGNSTNLNRLSANNQAEVYIKNIDSVVAQESSIQAIVSKVDGLAYLGRQFGAVRARREDENLRNVVGGVSKAIFGTAPTADRAAGVVGTFGYGTAYDHSETSYAPLFANTSGAAQVRSVFFDTLLDAMAGVATEFEEPFYYLAVNAATFNVLRKENVLDGSLVTDGNISFNTLLGGKIRLVLTGSSATAGAVDANATTSVLMAPGALVYANVSVPNPTGIDRDELAHNGGGIVSIINRWGNIIHPRGYNWTGAVNAYPANTVLNTAASWTAVAANVNQTGLFPIFHC